MYSPPLTHFTYFTLKGDLHPLPCCFGGADQARTDDPLLAKQVLYQLSYNPKTLHFHLKANEFYTLFKQMSTENFILFVDKCFFVP